MYIKIERNPLNHEQYNSLSDCDYYNILGIIPDWLSNDIYSELTAKKALSEQYIFGFHEIKKSTVTEDGIMKYPGDPDLYPLAKITRKDEIVYQYFYGIVAIIDKDCNSFVTRMD